MTPIPLRIFRAFKANYYENDVLRGPAVYPDRYFGELVENGFNAVWLRGVLRDLVDAEPFPGMGRGQSRQQEALGTVVERARRYGVQVLLYLNEPMGFPADHEFWRAHPEVGGSSGTSPMDEWSHTRAFCTSEPAAQVWIERAMEALFRAVPELGGWFLIAASEHHTHCYSHVGWGEKLTCPRCARRNAEDVVADLIVRMRNGTRRASPAAQCIVWNWSWDMLGPDPQSRLMAQLPKDVAVLGDWERGGWTTMPGGRQKWIDEYSLSYIGPSERFIRLRDEARRHGLKVMAKLQVGTTHELATVPNLPLIDNLYEKLSRAGEAGVSGILGTWNFGNSFNWNTAALARFVRDPDRPGPRLFVERMAADYFPGCDARGVAEAVERFSASMVRYPFSMSLLYSGPMNYALAYPLTLDPLTGKPMGRSWVMDERGDDLAPSASGFSLEEVVDLFATLVCEWEAGVEVLAKALAGCRQKRARLELNNARMIGLAFRSTVNVYRTYVLRRDRPENRRERFRVLVRDEMAVLKAALPLMAEDSRLGFHAECQARMFTPAQLRKKLAGLRRALKRGS